MSKEVKRYGMCGFESGIVEMEEGPCVAWDDYDALLAERDRMKDTLEHIRDTIDAQMAIIASRAPGKYLDKLPVVRSLRMHRNHADAALQGEQP